MKSEQVKNESESPTGKIKSPTGKNKNYQLGQSKIIANLPDGKNKIPDGESE